MEIRANQDKLGEQLKDCDPWPPVRDFCNAPLSHSAPKAAAAAEIAKGNCPKPVLALAAGASVLQPKALLGAPGIVGSSWQDAVLRGLAAFMVQRAEQEAVLSVADGMQTAICKDPKAEKLFPTLCALLGTGDVYDNPPSWTALRAAVERDLKDLPLTVLEQYPTDNPDRDEATLTATDLAEQALLLGHPPLPLFAAMASRFEKDAQPPKPGQIANPYRTGLYVAGIAAEIAWPAISESGGNDDRMLAAMVSARLLYDFLQSKGIVTGGKVDIQAVQAVVQSIEDAYGRTAEGNDSSTTENEDKALRFQLSTALARSLGLAYQVVAPDGDGKVVLAVFGDLVDAVQALSAGDYPRSVVDLAAALKTFAQVEPVPPAVLRYTQLLAELVVAKDADQAKQAIVAAAAPAGSWRGKREPGKVTFAINGYVGLQGGREWLGSSDLPRAPSWTYGLYAPVGFEGTVGLGKKAGSLGLFFSFVDLGALLDFRTEGSSSTASNGTSTVQTDQAPAYTFKEVFSPGLFLRYGLGPVPLVAGAGVSLTPELRRVTVVESNTRRDLPAFHVGVFLAMDVTLLPF